MNAPLAEALPWVMAVLLLGLAAVQLRQQRALKLALFAARNQARDLTRTIRVTAGDLRGPALGLLGQAEHAPQDLKAPLASLSRGLLDLAEALLEQTEDPQAPRRLREEEVPLGPLLEFVMANVVAQLGPARRAWRVSPELARVTLVGDRRALHQILLRVLSAAALATAEGDWIDIGMEAEADGFTLLIEDEGAGLPLPKIGGPIVETRGLGLGLTLASCLMQAHGGSLDLESRASVGTRTRLRFPARRALVA
jgi:signal transduction histidine kinase